MNVPRRNQIFVNIIVKSQGVKHNHKVTRCQECRVPPTQVPEGVPCDRATALFAWANQPHPPPPPPCDDTMLIKKEDLVEPPAKPQRHVQEVVAHHPTDIVTSVESGPSVTKKPANPLITTCVHNKVEKACRECAKQNPNICKHNCKATRCQECRVPPT